MAVSEISGATAHMPAQGCAPGVPRHVGTETPSGGGGGGGCSVCRTPKGVRVACHTRAAQRLRVVAAVAADVGTVRNTGRALWSSRADAHHRMVAAAAADARPLGKADSTLRSSRAVPHPSTNRALRRLTSEVRRDPVHSTRYGRQRRESHGSVRAAQCAHYAH